MDNLSVKFIFVRPRTSHRFIYAINDNIETWYSGSKMDVYYFICQFIKPPLTVKIMEFLDFHREFVVDIAQNEIIKLNKDSQSIEDFHRAKIHQIDISKINNKFEENITTKFQKVDKFMKKILDKTKS